MKRLPLLLLVLLGGVWADRLQPQRVMIGSDLVRLVRGVGVAALLLSLATDDSVARAADRDHAGSVGGRLAARSALVEEIVHAVHRRGQIGEIDRWVITQATRLAAAGGRVIEANLSAASIGTSGRRRATRRRSSGKANRAIRER